MYRRKLRENLFILVFESAFKSDSPCEILDCAKDIGDLEIDDELEHIFCDIFSKLEDIDNNISKYLRNWSINRISKVSLAILRLAFYEMTYVPEMKDVIAINEAVVISKKYTLKSDTGFINGVLGEYHKVKNA